MATWRLPAAAWAVTAIAALSGCGLLGSDGQAESPDSKPSGIQESLAAAPPGADDRTGPAGQLTLANDPNLGPILTDSVGFTLYRFTEDGQTDGASACEGKCADLWPPVPAEGASVPAGLDSSLLGSVARQGGGRQLTVGGLPMYRYAKDAKPGQVAGDGVGGTWFASLPSRLVPSSSQDGSAFGEASPSGEGAAAAGNGVPSAVAAGPGLSVSQHPSLGSIVVDAEGRTLYRFVKDTDWPMSSACTGSCLDRWEPAAVVDRNDVSGIDPKKVIPFDRPDGIAQQTLDCWPLYRFTGDAEAGDINGQGVDGAWYAVAADGSLRKRS
ncbi:SCO0930 family lipoprotein [Streptomyces antibioticus]|uniref:SCO0930 family lipoprotein n=1 Tax=Streptomyces antibioticus TaxID=1890 RepID=UPI0036F973A4